MITWQDRLSKAMAYFWTTLHIQSVKCEVLITKHVVHTLCLIVSCMMKPLFSATCIILYVYYMYSLLVVAKLL